MLYKERKDNRRIHKTAKSIPDRKETTKKGEIIMRKNKFMRAASGLLVAVLLTTCVISGTFAKYTTSSTGTDSARVAKWGFEDTSTVLLDDLFAKAYDGTVQSDAKVIAPGTEGSKTFKFDYTNPNKTPEVKYTFTVSTDGSTCAQSIQDNKNIQWKLDDGTWGTWDKLTAAIEGLAGDTTKTTTYAAGVLPKAFNGTTTHTVAWRWIFDEKADNADGATNNDVKDTEMGNAADLANVTLKITITATQVD